MVENNLGQICGFVHFYCIDRDKLTVFIHTYLGTKHKICVEVQPTRAGDAFGFWRFSAKLISCKECNEFLIEFSKIKLRKEIKRNCIFNCH